MVRTFRAFFTSTNGSSVTMTRSASLPLRSILRFALTQRVGRAQSPSAALERRQPALREISSSA
jgi:hypothetical protein